MSSTAHETKTQRILIVLIAVQAGILAIMFSGDPSRVPVYLGFAPGLHGTLLAWTLAAIVTVTYVWSASKISDVRRYLFRLDRLKIIAVIAAALASIIEEVVCRKLVMDFLHARGFGNIGQVVASAVAFGVIHVFWGIKSIAAAVNAVLSTTILGAALAIIYIVGDRSLAPCVVAHGLISGLIEPGLMIAAVSDRLGVWREKPAN